MSLLFTTTHHANSTCAGDENDYDDSNKSIVESEFFPNTPSGNETSSLREAFRQQKRRVVAAALRSCQYQSQPLSPESTASQETDLLVSPIHPVDPPENVARTIISTPAPRHQDENNAAQTSAPLAITSTPACPHQQVENIMEQTTQREVKDMKTAELIVRLKRLANGKGHHQDEDENDSAQTSVPSIVTTSARQQKEVENAHLLAILKYKRRQKRIERRLEQAGDERKQLVEQVLTECHLIKAHASQQHGITQNHVSSEHDNTRQEIRELKEELKEEMKEIVLSFSAQKAPPPVPVDIHYHNRGSIATVTTAGSFSTADLPASSYKTPNPKSKVKAASTSKAPRPSPRVLTSSKRQKEAEAKHIAKRRGR